MFRGIVVKIDDRYLLGISSLRWESTGTSNLDYHQKVINEVLGKNQLTRESAWRHVGSKN